MGGEEGEGEEREEREEAGVEDEEKTRMMWVVIRFVYCYPPQHLEIRRLCVLID